MVISLTAMLNKMLVPIPSLALYRCNTFLNGVQSKVTTHFLYSRNILSYIALDAHDKPSVEVYEASWRHSPGECTVGFRPKQPEPVVRLAKEERLENNSSENLID